MKRRWSRFFNPEHGNCLMLPVDHGLTMGPIQGIEHFKKIERILHHPAIDAVLLHVGLLKHLVDRKMLAHKAVCLHLNGTINLASDSSCKPILTGIENAVRHGADAVSLDILFTPENTPKNLSLLAATIREADQCGLPTLIMLGLKREVGGKLDFVAMQRQYIRALCELGATSVKLRRPNGFQEMQSLLDGLCEDIQILFAGGETIEEESMVEYAAHAVSLGARGVCVGRNIFQRSDPDRILNRIRNAWGAINGKGGEKPILADMPAAR